MAVREFGGAKSPTNKARRSSGDAGNIGIEVQPQRSAEEVVTEALRKAIHRGLLKPGQKLSQTDLAEQLGVSRIPLRDALRRLESEDLVTMNGRRGTWVSYLSTDELREIYEIRLMLEERCTIRAVKNMSDADIEQIIELFDAMEGAEAHPGESEFMARRSFYARFYECANRPLMREQILLLRDNVSRYHRVKDHGHSHDAHVQFKDAIIARDAKGAARILVRHLKEARDDLLKDMETEPNESD